MLMNGSWPGALPRAANQKLPQVRSLSPWFEIREVSADTFALLEPHHCEEVISYLIIGTRQAVLFDTGMGIADIGAEVRRLTRQRVIAVNSHSHYDHVAGNHLFEEVWLSTTISRSRASSAGSVPKSAGRNSCSPART